ncbi:MAG: FadR family transcriptional regulator, partial [Deltaproteobacteria bacterium]|nr:FadR family transcriptional regulator [Deltaproteobacteria bacterium]
MRILFEMENAKLAARNRTDLQASELKKIVKKEEDEDKRNIDKLIDLDFEFHLLLAMATDNFSYPLLLNSFKQFYTNLTGLFFRNASVIPTVLEFHNNLADAVEKRDEKIALKIMENLLSHGEKHLRAVITE